jgi:hypothetical protein
VRANGGDSAGKRLPVGIERPTDLFNGVPETFYAGFYHSETVLEADIPKDFTIIARSGGDVAGIAHKTDAVFGCSFTGIVSFRIWGCDRAEFPKIWPTGYASGNNGEKLRKTPDRLIRVKNTVWAGRAGF